MIATIVFAALALFRAREPRPRALCTAPRLRLHHLPRGARFDLRSRRGEPVDAAVPRIGVEEVHDAPFELIRPERRHHVAYERIRLESTAPVARITLSWPEKRNALSVQMMQELTAGLEELGRSRRRARRHPRRRGPGFLRGPLPARDGRQGHRASTPRLRHLRRDDGDASSASPSPSSPKCPGIATAAGCQLVATCDLAVASEEARFATPASRSGSSARRPWWRSRARWAASARCRCCSPGA